MPEQVLPDGEAMTFMVLGRVKREDVVETITTSSKWAAKREFMQMHPEADDKRLEVVQMKATLCRETADEDATPRKDRESHEKLGRALAASEARTECEKCHRPTPVGLTVRCHMDRRGLQGDLFTAAEAATTPAVALGFEDFARRSVGTVERVEVTVCRKCWSEDQCSPVRMMGPALPRLQRTPDPLPLPCDGCGEPTEWGKLKPRTVFKRVPMSDADIRKLPQVGGGLAAKAAWETLETTVQTVKHLCPKCDNRKGWQGLAGALGAELARKGF